MRETCTNDSLPVGNCRLPLASGRFLFVDSIQERLVFGDGRQNRRLTIGTIDDQFFDVRFIHRRFTHRTTDAERITDYLIATR